MQCQNSKQVMVDCLKTQWNGIWIKYIIIPYIKHNPGDSQGWSFDTMTENSKQMMVDCLKTQWNGIWIKYIIIVHNVKHNLLFSAGKFCWGYLKDVALMQCQGTPNKWWLIAWKLVDVDMYQCVSVEYVILPFTGGPICWDSQRWSFDIIVKEFSKQPPPPQQQQQQHRNRVCISETEDIPCEGGWFDSFHSKTPRIATLRHTDEKWFQMTAKVPDIQAEEKQ